MVHQRRLAVVDVRDYRDIANVLSCMPSIDTVHRAKKKASGGCQLPEVESLIQLLPLGWSEGPSKNTEKSEQFQKNRGRAKSGLFRPSRPLTERVRKLVSHRMLDTPTVK